MFLYNIFLIYLSLLISIQTTQIPSESYEKLNTFKSIIKNESFIIKTKVKSIAYLDSFDKKSIIYISKNQEDFLAEKDEKITGKFQEIEPNTNYYIRNYLYSAPSIFKTYLYPLDLSKEEINITDENYLYLEKNKNYTLNFYENKINKMIKLSRKTLNTKIIITKENEDQIELNKNNLYYEIGDFSEKLLLEIKEEDAFIEFLSDYGEDYDTIEEIKIDNYQLKNNITLIKIPKIDDKIFVVTASSDKEFSLSFSYGFSNRINYYYSNSDSLNVPIKINKKNDLILQFPFKNINLLKDEFLSFAIKFQKEPEQIITISYFHSSYFMEPYVNEKLDKPYCNDIINNLNTLLEYYVYLDIAKNPPEIEDIPNYHHRKIDLKGELSKVSTENRKFYEFYQEILKILTATKDLHFDIKAFTSPKRLKFYEQYVYLPFNFIIQGEKNDIKIYIRPNRFLDEISQKEKNFIISHMDIPLKNINDMDLFDYIQNWSKFKATKNIHAQFSYIINKIPSYYLNEFPNNFSDMFNEYEFEDNKILRLKNLYNIVEESGNESEFGRYFQSFVKNIKFPFIMPPIEDIKEEFLIFKGLKEKNLKAEEEIVKWDIKYNKGNKFIKCRVDNENQTNVLVINSFQFELNNVLPLIFDCARLFYSNNYSLIIIESRNDGGNGVLATLMQQILHPRLISINFFFTN